MIKAAFFDVDGTLLSHVTKTVSQSAREAIAKLKAAGIQCVLATGRQMIALEQLQLTELPFDGYVTLNGQVVLDEGKQILHGVPIVGEALDYLLRTFRDNDLPVMLVEKDRMYVNFIDERVVRVHEAISSPLPSLGEYSGGDVYQICVYMADDDEAKLKPIAGQCEIARWNLGGVDVIAKGGGKVAGILRYLDANGIKPEEIIAFGDGDNDVDMLKFAGIGVCMGNGWESAKEAADYVTADVDADGIHLALAHFGLI